MSGKVRAARPRSNANDKCLHTLWKILADGDEHEDRHDIYVSLRISNDSLRFCRRGCSGRYDCALVVCFVEIRNHRRWIEALEFTAMLSNCIPSRG